MWRNPRYPAPEQPEAPTAPVERGRRLLTLPRGDGEELRANLDEFNGHPFLALRIWQKGQDGVWWPVKGKGISIRIRELEDVAEALRQAAEMTN